LSIKKPFYIADRAAQLLLNTILAPQECRMPSGVVVNMQQVGAHCGGAARARQRLPESGPVKAWQIH
jgi:hypothetical protein